MPFSIQYAKHSMTFRTIYSSEQPWQAQTMQKGAALVPLSVYFSGNYAKMQIGVGRGKKLYDKREALKQKDDKREIERAFRQRQKA